MHVYDRHIFEPVRSPTANGEKSIKPGPCQLLVPRSLSTPQQALARDLGVSDASLHSGGRA